MSWGKQKIDVKFSGTTANAWILGPNRILTWANIGDSRAILIQWHNEGTKEEIWSCKQISRDHKPDLNDEKARIESHGGVVSWYKDSRCQNVGPPRVWLK